jgi:hypothetical protein
MGGGRRGRWRAYVPSPAPLLVVDSEWGKESIRFDEQTTRINRVGVAGGLTNSKSSTFENPRPKIHRHRLLLPPTHGRPFACSHRERRDSTGTAMVNGPQCRLRRPPALLSPSIPSALPPAPPPCLALSSSYSISPTSCLSSLSLSLSLLSLFSFALRIARKSSCPRPARSRPYPGMPGTWAVCHPPLYYSIA